MVLTLCRQRCQYQHCICFHSQVIWKKKHAYKSGVMVLLYSLISSYLKDEETMAQLFKKCIFWQNLDSRRYPKSNISHNSQLISTNKVLNESLWLHLLFLGTKIEKILIFFYIFSQKSIFVTSTLICIYPESRRTCIATVLKVIFLPIEFKFFSARFGPIGLRNCNKKFHIMCLSSVWCYNAKFVTGVAVTVLVLFAWNLVHLCIYGIPRDTREIFLKFWFFWFLSRFWTLKNCFVSFELLQKVFVH